MAFSQQTENITDTKGNKQGAWVKKDEKGKLIYSGTFSDNKPTGEFIYYDSLGSVKAKSIFTDNGTKAYTTVFSQGHIVSEGQYVNEKKHGVWKYYNHDSIVIAEETYEAGVAHGIWKVYYSNGALLEEMPYKQGLREGTWQQYFIDGPLKTKATYIKDKLEGLATFFHPNGRVFISGPYKDNFKDGIWMHLDDKGVAVKKEVWQMGYLTAEEFYDKAAEKMMKEEK